MRSIIPNLIIAHKHLIKANQVSCIAVCLRHYYIFIFQLDLSTNVTRSERLKLFHCCAQEHACEAMEVFNELMESEVSIIVPHIAEIISFCLEVGIKPYFYFLAL